MLDLVELQSDFYMFFDAIDDQCFATTKFIGREEFPLKVEFFEDEKGFGQYIFGGETRDDAESPGSSGAGNFYNVHI